ncbi:alkaline phosphatase family protein [Paraconexibacter algicola]|nr:alkaline phosphatase family protein [Paraconexibacter algicola]
MHRDRPPLDVVRAWAEQRFPDRAWPWAPTTDPDAPDGAGRPARLTLSTRAAAGASGAVLALGIGIGLASGPGPDSSLAATGDPVVVVGPAAGPLAAAPAPAPLLAPAPAPTPAPGTAAEEPATDAPAVTVDPAPAPAVGAPATDAPAPAAEEPAADEEPTDAPATDQDPATGDVPTTAGPARPALPTVGKVTVVWMADGRSERTFGPDSPMPYVARTLAAEGLVLPRYHAVTRGAIGNGVALLGGLAATPEQLAGCTTPTAGTCVLPEATPSLLNQLTGAGRTWKVYAGALGATGVDSCRAPELDRPDPAGLQPRPGDAFATARVPALWFASVTAGADCGSVVDLGQLDRDLAAGDDAIPDFSLVVPDVCDSGIEVPCPDGRPSGPAAADAFLATLVPKLTGTAAHRKDGLVIVVWDQAPATGPFADARPCCSGRPDGVPGGGRTGAVVLSPFVTAGTVQDKPYDHLALLRTLEDLFGLDRLGLAADPAVQGFGPKVLAAPAADGDR